MAGCLGLIKHFFYSQAHGAGWNVPFELFAGTVAEHGGPNGREDGYFPIVDVRVSRKDECVGHYFIRLQIADLCLRIHRHDIFWYVGWGHDVSLEA